jgi:hypothetical protein
MTTEELVAAGLPAEPIVEGPENAPRPEDGGSLGRRQWLQESRGWRSQNG